VIDDLFLGSFQIGFLCMLRTNSCGFDCVVCVVLCVEQFGFQLYGSSDWTAKIDY